MCSCSERGQATVEAAVLLPVLLAVMGALLQPAILLFDRCVMNDAAAEGCRLLSTANVDEQAVREYVRRRLASVPELPVFHEGAWEVELSGGEGTASVSVTVVNRVHALPLPGIVPGLASQIDGAGRVVQRVEVSSSVVPAWAADAGSPSEWIASWK